MSKTKWFHVYANAIDSKGYKHIITVVGKLEQKREKLFKVVPMTQYTKPYKTANGFFCYGEKEFHRKLTLGMSICHPLDRFDEETGIKVAKSRIKNGRTLGSVETSDVTMLTEDAVMGELLIKLKHLVENIDDYVP